MKSIKEFLKHNKVLEGLLPKEKDIETNFIKDHIIISNSGRVTVDNDKIIIDTDGSVEKYLGEEGIAIVFKGLRENALKTVFEKLVITHHGDNAVSLENCELTFNLLCKLRHIDNVGNIHIYNCNSLKKIPWLDNCCGISIKDCHSLESVSDMNNYGYVKIENCSSLKTIENFKNNRYVLIRNCNSLKTILGLKNKGDVNIEDCSSLEEVDDITNGGDVKVSGCNSLKTILGLKNKGDVNIEDCSSLESVPWVYARKLNVKNCPNYKKNKKNN